MLPQKLFFRIGEVAGLVGVEPHVLRYWEREFRSIRPTKSAKGQRVYSRKDVENLLRVRDLLYRDGFTIAGAKKKLKGSDGDEPSASAASVASAADDSTAAVEIEAGAESGDRDTAFPSASEHERDVRQKLLALRQEVEGFLEELGTPRRQG